MMVIVEPSNIFLDNYKLIKSKKHKEHIFLYFYSNKNKFKIYNITKKKNSKNVNQSIDTFEDYMKVKKYLEKK